MEKFFIAGPFRDGPFATVIVEKETDSGRGYETEQFKLDLGLLEKVGPDAWQRNLNHWLERLAELHKWPSDKLRGEIPATIELENLPAMPAQDLSQPCMVAAEFTKIKLLGEGG